MFQRVNFDEILDFLHYECSESGNFFFVIKIFSLFQGLPLQENGLAASPSILVSSQSFSSTLDFIESLAFGHPQHKAMPRLSLSRGP